MPTQRFYNLTESKKNTIIRAAKHEFSRALYSEASINKIIQEAGISRGSFYTYFEDKEDLLKYIMEDFQNKCKGAIWKALENAKGDLFNAVDRVVFYVIQHGRQNEDFNFYKNILSDYHLTTDTVGFRQHAFLHNYEPFHVFTEGCFQRLDKDKYKLQNAADFGYLLELLCIVSLKTIAVVYNGIASEEDAKKVYDKQMNILKVGVCR